MRNRKQTLALATFIAALLAVPALYAQDAHPPSGSTKSPGMMGGGNMMGRMSQMMDQCSSMMQGGAGGSRPNDQWRKNAPEKPDQSL